MSLSKRPDMKHAEARKYMFIEVSEYALLHGRCVYVSSARMNSRDVRMRNCQ